MLLHVCFYCFGTKIIKKGGLNHSAEVEKPLKGLRVGTVPHTRTKGLLAPYEAPVQPVCSSTCKWDSKRLDSRGTFSSWQMNFQFRGNRMISPSEVVLDVQIVCKCVRNHIISPTLSSLPCSVLAYLKCWLMSNLDRKEIGLHIENGKMLWLKVTTWYANNCCKARGDGPFAAVSFWEPSSRNKRQTENGKEK